MPEKLNIAFFAPIKPPDHPIPSGDRAIARNLIKVMSMAGHSVEVASEYICYSKRSAAEFLIQRKEGALEEALRIIQKFKTREQAERPDLWLTYHPYCKAPDWIGPRVAQEFSIPYVTVEAARTNQGQNDEWRPWRKEAQAGIKQADLHLWFKPTDRDYLIGLLGPSAPLAPIPVFLDVTGVERARAMELPNHFDRNTPVLVTAGMMRKGKKLDNFQILARSLSKIDSANWNLLVIGGGPEEAAVQGAFSAFDPKRLHFTGEVSHSEVLQWMAAGDLFVWPGWKEPIGMVYLEAQLQELPIAAMDSMGVPLVVADGTTGRLAKEGDEAGLADAIRLLLEDRDNRHYMGKAARKRVLAKHDLQTAADRLSEVFRQLTGTVT